MLLINFVDFLTQLIVSSEMKCFWKDSFALLKPSAPYLFFLSDSCVQISCHRRLKLPNFSWRILASVFEDCWIISSPVVVSVLTTTCRCPMPSWSSCKPPRKTKQKWNPKTFNLKKKKSLNNMLPCTVPPRGRNRKAHRKSRSTNLLCPHPKATRQKDNFHVSKKAHSQFRCRVCL